MDILGYRLPTPVAVILTVNAAVFLLWRVPSLQPFMYRHFTTDLYRVLYGRQLHTVVTHAFSHQSFLHLFFNCLAFATIAPSLSFFMTDAQFFAFYVSAAAVSTLLGFALTALFSLPSHRAVQLRIPALGASGAVFAVFAASALAFPDVQYRVLLIPYDIPASTVLPCAAAFDVAGLVYNMVKVSAAATQAHTSHPTPRLACPHVFVCSAASVLPCALCRAARWDTVRISAVWRTAARCTSCGLRSSRC